MPSALLITVGCTMNIEWVEQKRSVAPKNATTAIELTLGRDAGNENGPESVVRHLLRAGSGSGPAAALHKGTGSRQRANLLR